MKINSIKIIGSILAITLLVGCSSKKDSVVYNDINDGVKTESSNMDNKAHDNMNNNVDDKLSNVQTSDSNINNSDLSSSFNNDSYMNQVTSTINGESITLTSIHFDFNKYQLKDDMISISSQNSSKINNVLNKDNNVKVKVEGNCDEWGNDEYNFALGLKRAKTVKNDLINNGVNSSNIIIVSLGESNPICRDQTNDCWKKNRRVDHILLP